MELITIIGATLRGPARRYRFVGLKFTLTRKLLEGSSLGGL